MSGILLGTALCILWHVAWARVEARRHRRHMLDLWEFYFGKDLREP